MLYGDFGISILTGYVNTIQSAEYDRGELKVTFIVKRQYGRAFTTYFVIASERYVPWIRKIRQGDHIVMICYMNFANPQGEEKKASLVLSPTQMFVLDHTVETRPDGIIVKKT